MHTKGPWLVNPFRAQVDCGSPSLKGGLLPIAQMLWPTDERTEAETAANACLIAAAPMLLEAAALALKIAEGWIDDRLAGASSYAEALAELEPVRAALAAARQESAS